MLMPSSMASRCINRGPSITAKMSPPTATEPGPERPFSPSSTPVIGPIPVCCGYDPTRANPSGTAGFPGAASPRGQDLPITLAASSSHTTGDLLVLLPLDWLVPTMQLMAAT